MSNDDLIIFENAKDKELDDIKKDKLGFKDLIDPFIKYIAKFSPPVVVGIYGEWGSGKSTFVNFYLKNIKEDIFPITFDSWKYKEDKTLWKSFILKILKELSDEEKLGDKVIIKKEIYEKNASKLCSSEDNLLFKPSKKQIKLLITGILSTLLLIGGLYFYIDRSLLNIIGVSAFVSILVFILSFVQVKRTTGPINTFLEFEDNIEDLKKQFYGLDKKVIVTIENLDRVEPKYAVNLLESIKILFDFENFIYLIPCDPKVIEKEIREVYKKDIISAEDFLNKIVTVPFYLPPPNKENFEIFFKGLLNTSDNIMINNFIGIIEAASINNPRKIKKIVTETNMIHKFILGLKPEKQKIYIPFILKLVILKHEFPYIFQLLLKSPEASIDSHLKTSCEKLLLDDFVETDVQLSILRKILHYSPIRNDLDDRGTYPEDIKAAFLNNAQGFQFLKATYKYGGNPSYQELPLYLLSVSVVKGQTKESTEGIKIEVEKQR